MIRQIFSLNILVMHVTKINFILSSSKKTCFRYEEITTTVRINIEIGMLGTIFGV